MMCGRCRGRGRVGENFNLNLCWAPENLMGGVFLYAVGMFKLLHSRAGQIPERLVSGLFGRLTLTSRLGQVLCWPPFVNCQSNVPGTYLNCLWEKAVSQILGYGLMLHTSPRY